MAGDQCRIWPPLLIGYILNSFFAVYCREVVLLDSAVDSVQKPVLGWTTYKSDSKNGENENLGWMEATVNKDGETLKTYSSCYVKTSNVDNWLRLPYIPRGEANSLHISLTFTMRKCSKLIDSTNLQQCKETFNLYYFDAGSDFANALRPSWDALTYKRIDKIAADKLFVDNTEQEYNEESRQIALTSNVRGVYFAIQDEGGCVTLVRVKVYYITCPNITVKFGFFPETPTGDRDFSVVSQKGTCVDNATQKTELSYLCRNDGMWYDFPKGECVCKPGFQGLEDTKCTACPAGTYKWSEGSDACEDCPSYSNSTEGSAECMCQPKYYRSPGDPKSKPCTQPPSAPQNPVIESQTATSVTLSWTHPADLGNRQDLNYRIVCQKCSGDVLFLPGWTGFNVTRVTLSRLEGGKTYEVIIYSENGVTSVSGTQAQSVSVNIVTQSLGKVMNVRKLSIGPKYLTIGWDIPSSMKSRVLQYQIRYYPRGDEASAIMKYSLTQNFTLTEFMLQTEYIFLVRGETQEGWGEFSDPFAVQTGNYGSTIVGVRRISIGPKHITVAWDVPQSIKDYVLRYEVRYSPRSQEQNMVSAYTTHQNLTITDFILDTEYEIQVRCETSNTGWGELSEPLIVQTGQKESASTPIGIIVGSIVAVILCMAIATIMIIILLRRNRPNCSEKKDCDAYTHGVQADLARVTMPLFPSPGSVHSSVRTYVDPHTYEDPNQAVREFTREIDACHITIESVIGGGEFGDVCKGKLRMPGHREMNVAIKTLKPGATEKNRLDFLTEASIMGQFDDPNVIFLEGVVTKSNPIMIVTEYMANGSLDTFLRNNDGKFTIIQLVGMMRGVASGMKYLSEMGFVHRDLAARNILVNENLVCKVADFGLSREIESDTTEGAYTTTGGKIPVRWTAPEAIAFRKFTSASDVWSYGVVMWEIVSYGERPYYNWSNQDVIKAVEKGYRLPPPMDCPEAIHQLMLDCWQKERSHRPKLGQIVKTLDKLIRAPELLRKQAKPRPHNFIDPSSPDMSSLLSVEEWLQTIKMERYLGLFQNAGLTTMDKVRHLTVRDLLNMGISLVGHQKKIMNSIQTFRAQTGDGLQQNMAQAALV
ncbi:ephrin type-B receptor 1-B-like isoform X3 [Biomphalaria glabrata]|uniref:receptor protein-tyrosine kinase n=1 Tax=Biomphalaria glabrata TaxID=6526 RepID=A0A9W2YL42_BIOGL|nr:ephrin type-B receptor 1-B-like isoform X3 [Biomphalaria glabrata]